MKRAFLGLSPLVVISAAFAGNQLLVGPSISLSDDQVPDFGAAFKVKLAQMESGRLVAIFGDGVGDLVYDTKDDAVRPARDLFSRTCNPKLVDCSDEASWSAPINLSNTASLSSISTQWLGPLSGDLPYAGDNDKPNIFDNNDVLMATWTSKYCPGGEQGSVTYLERDEREIPYACMYVARSLDGGTSWLPAEQLSDGWRDAKQDTPRGTDFGWAISWQEDPQGLQLGEADGPGEGASGANVSHGTDVWYTWLDTAGVLAGTPFNPSVRLTNNFTRTENKQGTFTEIEAGTAGASRPNLSMVSNSVIVAYEETKGSSGTDTGKYIRYHAFRYDLPPTSCQPPEAGDTDDTDAACQTNARGEPYPAQEDPARVGCILSDPNENSRRVRFLTQGTPGTNSGIKLYIFWKQGLYDKGGPSDILGRAGRVRPGTSGALAGFGLADFVPPVAVPTATTLGDPLDGCYIPGDELVGDGAQANAPAQNLSAETEVGGDLTAGTDDNNNEDARAHRGILSGDFIALGHSYTPDWAVARYTDLENYEFWMRTSTNGGQTWGAPVDLTSATTTAQAALLGLGPNGVNVKEPRIIKTPPSGPGCPTGSPTAPDTTDPEDCRNGNVITVAWGSETNVYEHLGGSQDLDLFVTRSTNKGATWEPVQVLAGNLSFLDDEEAESQLQMPPDGKTVYAVWNQTLNDLTDAMFAVALETFVSDDTDGDGIPDDVDFCDGNGANDADGDSVCDGDDVCVGDDATGDEDGDALCADLDYTLSVSSPLTRGGSVTLTVTGAPANQSVFFGVSSTGPGNGPCGSSQDGSQICSGLRQVQTLGKVRTNGAGAATLTITLPPGLRVGDSVWFRSVHLRGSGDVTPIVQRTLVAAP